MKKSDLLLLTGIILLGTILRVIWITKIPPSLNWDEASVGYDAYSIIATGKDQWGQTLPMVFKSFGDFKSPIHIYFTALFTLLFGYGILSVRIGSAIFGIVNILLLFILAKRLTNNKTVAFLATLFLSISPWAIQYSRANWEENYALCFFFISVIFFLKGIKENKAWLIASFALFGLDLLTYHATKIFIPLFIVSLVVIYFKDLVKYKAYFLIGLLIFSGFILINLAIPNLSGLARFDQVNVQKNGGFATVTKNYFSHFSSQFLFISGDYNPRHSIQMMGELYLYDVFLLPLGIYFLLTHRSKWSWLILTWLFLSPIPASIATETPHASRDMFALGVMQIISAIGFYYLLASIKKSKIRLLFIIFSSLIFIIFTEIYLIKYFKYYPTQYSKEWQYGYMKIFTGNDYDFSKYKKVVVSDGYGQPYIFALYYLEYNPDSFRKSVIYNPTGKNGEQSVKSFGNFVFKPIETSDLEINTLIFSTPSDRLIDVSPVGEIKDINGSTSFYIYSK